MKSIRPPLAVLVLVICVTSTVTLAQAAEPALDSEEQKTIYALGLLVSRNLGSFGLTESELATVVSGLQDGVLGREPRVDVQQYGPKVQALAQSRAKVLAAVEAKKAEAFLAKASQEPGVEKSDSGLLYLEIEAGSGASPKATDKVTVHYHGTLIDGTVFDSSVDRGTPATFPLNGVIKCWTEGVQKMKVGGKSRLICPADIAYGDRGSPPTIKPGAALSFEVELISIAE